METVSPGDENAGFPLTPEDLPDFVRAVDVFDQARTAFSDACEEFASQPSDEAQSNVGLYGSLLVRSFRTSLDAISRAELDINARFTAITQLLVFEDAKRNELFGRLTACPDFKPYDESDKDGMVEAMKEAALDVETEGELLDSFQESYADVFQQELDHFANHILAKPGKEQAAPGSQPETGPGSGQSRKMAIGREIGKHALDIAKISAGVALGIWLSRRPRA